MNDDRGAGTWGAIAPPIFLQIGEIVAFSNPNISRSKEGTEPESHWHSQYFTPSGTPVMYEFSVATLEMFEVRSCVRLGATETISF